MIRRLYAILLAVAFLAVSCQKEMSEGGGSRNPASSVPADFDWIMTHDVSATVGMPTVEGNAPDYAVVRLYASPNLVDENVVAMGVVKTSQPNFSTVMTLPADVERIYVRTTLPDGTVSVTAKPATAAVNVSGVAMKSASAPRLGLMAATRAESSMPDYPVLEPKTEADFAPEAILRQTPAQKLKLGAAAPEYFIPAGAVVEGNINFTGNSQPYTDPVLYVAGKLTLDAKAVIGRAAIAVLPGGEVSFHEVQTTHQPEAVHPAIYVLEGGKFSARNADFNSKYIVNNGTFIVEEEMDLGNGLVFCNTVRAAVRAGDIDVKNKSSMFNDGMIVADDFDLDSQSEFTNSGSFQVNGEMDVENRSVFYQKGDARIEDFGVKHATAYIECYTITAEVEIENAEVNIAAGAGLDTQLAEFEGSKLDMGAGSIFMAEEFNVDTEKGGNEFTSLAGADQLPAVILFTDNAYSSRKCSTYFSGRMEVVYTNNKYFQIWDNSFRNGAYMTPKQTVVIPASHCNGDKEPIEPEPEPEPEYIESTGTTYTYCFEDGWPWMGDYDMNDVVVVASITRRSDKATGKVGSIRINWELKAAGAAHLNAFAVQLDKVRASEVASVETTNTSFGSGAFAGPGLESGAEYAIIPLFNTAQEILGEGVNINTTKGASVPTVKHTTTVTFTQPVDADAVTESSVNAFIVVNQKSSGAFTRETEIHMPTYKPTQFAVVSGSSFLPEEPYKFYIAKGEGMKNNYMMWALRIPGDFRYPLERQDIRNVYTYFSAWAASSGTQHKDWYRDESDENLLY